MNNNTSVVSESIQDQPKRSDAATRWRRLLEDQRVSGLPVSAFCRERGIPQSSLFAWRRRLGLGPGGRLKLGAAEMFKPVKLLGESKPPRGADKVQSDAAAVELSAASFVELYLSGRHRLIVRRGFDRQLLLEVIDTLEQRS